MLVSECTQVRVRVRMYVCVCVLISGVSYKDLGKTSPKQKWWRQNLRVEGRGRWRWRWRWSRELEGWRLRH